MDTSTASYEYFSEDFTPSFDGKVLIIGSGVAGMTAGYVLDGFGIDYEILEASNVYGGRIKRTTALADYPIDIGAEWVHPKVVGGGRDVPFLNDILTGTDDEFETFVEKHTSFARFKDGKLHTGIKWVSPVINLSEDLKFKSRTWFDVLETRVHPIVKDQIHYNSPVAEINYQGETAVVKTKAGVVYEADRVLVTVPLTMLTSIDYLPPLPPNKVKAINENAAEVKPGFKVFMEFTEEFYPDVTQEGGPLGFFVNQHMYYNESYGKDSDKHVLGLFVKGKGAEYYFALLEERKNTRVGGRAEDEKAGEETEEASMDRKADDEMLLNIVLAELDTLYDGKATATFVKGIVQNWSAEPYIKGTYSAESGIKHREDLISPVGKKVYFAGEAMNEFKNTIAVHGAAESSYLSLKRMFEEYDEATK